MEFLNRVIAISGVSWSVLIFLINIGIVGLVIYIAYTLFKISPFLSDRPVSSDSDLPYGGEPPDKNSFAGSLVSFYKEITEFAGTESSFVLVIVINIAVISLVFSLISHLLNGEPNIIAWFDGASQNFSTEMMGAVLTFGLFELLVNRQKEDQREILNLVQDLRTRDNLEAWKVLNTFRQRDKEGFVSEHLFNNQVFDGANWEDLNLSGISFERASLQTVNLTGANLQHTNMARAKLQGAIIKDVTVNSETTLPDGSRFPPDYLHLIDWLKFTDPNHELFWKPCELVLDDIQGKNMSNQNLNGLYLENGASLKGTDFSYAKLIGASMKGCTLSNLKFTGANMANSRLAWAHLEGSNLRRTILINSNLKGTNLKGANLQNADLRGANLAEAKLINVNLNGADLKNANLKANLDSANLQNADLQGAYLRFAKLRKANLRSANLQNADLRGAYLRGANLIGANLLNTQFDERTVLPDARNVGNRFRDQYDMWTPETDMSRYTNVNHPRFWKPD